MRLYLVQHGKAMFKTEDPERHLTAEGQQEARRVARFVAPLGLRVGSLWHSGKPRAAQTAEIYAETIPTEEGPTAREGLAPEDNVALLRDELAVATEDIMIVGHMPFVAKLATLLLTGYETPAVIDFQKAGIVCLGRTDDNRWQVEWIVTPELLPE
ncbi:MAG: phosphohistidine phosphatase SixA [Sedimentisphaerales bacterium]|nr:phosphohistidine phosphatase SixA [Sedimentisphaerales bacterium]